MDLPALEALDELLIASDDPDLTGVTELLGGESSPRSNPPAADAEDATTCVQVSLRVLEHASRLSRRGSIPRETHFAIEDSVVASLIRNLGSIHDAATRGEVQPPVLEVVGVDFTRPLIFGALNFERLSFRDCSFLASVHFTGTRSVNTIKFSQCLISGSELLIRLTSFPKPDPPSDWRPSFSFEGCSIDYVYALGAEVFLHFKESKIRAMNLELPLSATVQFNDCQLHDVMATSVNEDFHGNDIVPREWYLDRGWTLG